MPLKVAIGKQDFKNIREEGWFYVDKTHFIREWWEAGDDVTLITRPRRFGKTLNMSMMEAFFSNKYAGRADLFEGLSIWEDKQYRQLQGTYPVIFLSFASAKRDNYGDAKHQICAALFAVYNQNTFLLQSDRVTDADKTYFQKILTLQDEMDEVTAANCLNRLSYMLYSHFGKKVIIFLDEYDTPMQEAYVNGYWKEMVNFTRSLFNASFKTNPALYRAVMTGITRVSKESIFSDFNNPAVITTTSEQYEDCFGFTEREVFYALEQQGLSDQKDHVKEWYDGFTFGTVTDIYNPWSILNYLKYKEFSTYWANSSANTLIGTLLRQADHDVKIALNDLLDGGELVTEIDEQIVFDQLDENITAIWSLMLASGYLKVVSAPFNAAQKDQNYHLKLTNGEVVLMFRKMIDGWFKHRTPAYNAFIKALLNNNLEEMNAYMNRIALATLSYFDAGSRPSVDTTPERFYHGFVLGLLVDLRDIYHVTSNRESGLGRYDIMLEPLTAENDAIIMEFKIHNSKKEKNLEDTVADALKQIELRKYDAELLARGISAERIRHYGFAFQEKTVLIGSAEEAESSFR